MKLFDDRWDMQEAVKRIKPYLPYADTVLRGILTAVLYWVMISLTVAGLRIDPFAGYQVVPYFGWIMWVVECVLVYYTLNTVILNFAIYNRADRVEFLSRTGSTFDQDEEAALLKKRSDVKLYLAVSCVSFALLPTPLGYTSLLFPILQFVSLPPILLRAVAILTFAVMSLILTQGRMLEARSYWLEQPKKLMGAQLWKGLERKLKGHYSLWHFVIKYAVNVVTYVIGAIMISMLVCAVYSFFGILLLFAAEWWLWAIIASLLLLFYSKAISRRRKLLKKMRALCKEYGFELFDCKHPYLSIFFNLKSYTFGITANGKTYYCRLIAGVNRLNKMYFDEQGFCTRTVTLSIPTPRVARVGGFAQFMKREDSEDLEIVRLRFRSKYFFEAAEKGEKIVLLNPVPRRVFFKRVGTPRQEIDNGDSISGYTVFTGNAFLRFLERGTGKTDD